MAAPELFKTCVQAIRADVMIKRVSAKDKEFHFQNWVEKRLEETKLPFKVSKRNTYPDFTMDNSDEGFEVKGLAYPGRVATFDSNSQMPTGLHNGRAIYYAFGRYPSETKDDEYPVVDLVLCHGDFLSADHIYVHKNKSVPGFGSYGDISIRDRKMYVVPLPFALLEGVDKQQTLILPAGNTMGAEFIEVGIITRIEADELVVGYSFDLKTNELYSKKVKNPDAGKKHEFRAWRFKGSDSTTVKLRGQDAVELAVEGEINEHEVEESAD